MADNQSRKYKVTWLDNLSAYTGRAYNRSTANLHTVIFSGLYDYDETDKDDEALAIELLNKGDKYIDGGDSSDDSSGSEKPDYKDYWKNWHNDYNIYKGGIRYTKFVDVADESIYIDDYKLSLEFDYPTGLVSLKKTFADNFKYYIGQKNPRELKDNDWADGEITYNSDLQINIIEDCRTNNNFKLFGDNQSKYYIVIPASLYRCGYMPMHDIEEADLQQDENSYHKFYIRHDGISYVCFMSDYATDKYVGIIGRKL